MPKKTLKELDLIEQLRLDKEAREYARDIIATIREPLIVLDIDLKIVLANKSFYQTFKVNPEETIGQFIYDLGNGQWNIPKLRQLLEDILPKNNTFENFEVRHNFETIGQKIMLLNARRIPQPPAKPKIILLAIEDITYRITKEEAVLWASEEKLRDLFENSNDIITYVDNRGKILDVNKRIKDVLGYLPKEIKGKNFTDLGILQVKDAPRILKLFGETIITRQPQKLIELELKRKNGSKVFMEVGTRFIRSDGHIKGIVNTFRDITERKTIEQTKDDFLNIAAHDLRTPMAEIRANTEMILSGDYGEMPPKLKVPLQDIDKAILNLIKMVDDFLTISRIEKGKMTINPKPIDLIPILNSIVKQIKPLVERSGLEFNCEIPAKLPLVLTDPDRISEVIINLLDNAIKFTDRGSISLKVGVEKDSVVVKVSDTGIGIAQERQKDLFKKYTQFGAEKRIAYGKGTGLGLGLYISRLIIEGCKGKIWVESELNKGSTFYFSLPIAKNIK